jgi:hypothetical protein
MAMIKIAGLAGIKTFKSLKEALNYVRLEMSKHHLRVTKKLKK